MNIVDWEYETYIGYLTQNLLSAYEIKQYYFKQRKINAELKLDIRKNKQAFKIQQELENKIEYQKQQITGLQKDKIIVRQNGAETVVPTLIYELALYPTLIKFVQDKIEYLNSKLYQNSHLLNQKQLQIENDYYIYILKQSLEQNQRFINISLIDRFIIKNEKYLPILNNVTPTNLKIYNFIQHNKIFFELFVKQFAYVEQLTLRNDTFLEKFNILQYKTVSTSSLGYYFLNKWSKQFEIKLKNYLDNIINETNVEETNLCLFALHCWQGKIFSNFGVNVLEIQTQTWIIQ